MLTWQAIEEGARALQRTEETKERARVAHDAMAREADEAASRLEIFYGRLGPRKRVLLLETNEAFPITGGQAAATGGGRSRALSTAASASNYAARAAAPSAAAAASGHEVHAICGLRWFSP